jgi:peroxiredoxin (alkyl hydroperoxide reductase subunit C)
MTFASMKDQFGSIGCSLLGLSVDSNSSHIEWARAMEKYQWKNIKDVKVSFPIIADDFGTVAKMYGMLMPAASVTKTVRTVFIIDPNGMIRAILIYPLTTGRNLQEIKRLVIALQVFDATGNPTPCDWIPSEEQVSSPPQTLPESQKRLDGQHASGYYCLDWYICFVNDNKNKPQTPPVPTPYSIPKDNSANITANAMPSMMAPNSMNNSNMIMNEMPMIMAKPMDNMAAKSNVKNDNMQQSKKTQQPVPVQQVPSGKKIFTLNELAKYNGKMGLPPYAAVNGVVYDLSSIISMPAHASLKPGTDLSKDFTKCHMGMSYLLSKLPVMGTLSASIANTSATMSSMPDNTNDYIITRDYPLY